MSCAHALLSLFLFAPCTDSGGPSMDLVIAQALASPSRPESDRLRDPLRRPDQILTFFEIGPGMKVLDLFSGGGYYTEILSAVVGSEGQVVSHNNDAYLAFVGKELEQRFADGHLGNVTRVTAEADALSLPENAFDAALAMLTWHDFYITDPENGWPAIDEPGLVGKLCAALKPGAVLGVVDHVAEPGADVPGTAEKLHRIDPERIKSDLAGTCFKFEGAINVLRNEDDDHSKSVFDPAVRGKTDRVVFRFRRE